MAVVRDERTVTGRLKFRTTSAGTDAKEDMAQPQRIRRAIIAAITCSCLFIAAAVVCAVVLAGPVASLIIRILILVFVAVAAASGAYVYLPREAPADGMRATREPFADLFERFTGHARLTLVAVVVFIVLVAIAAELVCLYTLRPLFAGVFGGREIFFIPLLMFCALASVLGALKALSRSLREGETDGEELPLRLLVCCAVVFCCALAILMCLDMTPVRNIGWSALIFAVEEAVAYALIIMFVYRGRAIQNSSPVVVQNPESALERKCKVVSRRYGLTKAEQVVLPLLMRGDSRPTMAEKLSVSLATINTHVQHIYQKTLTHKRPELVDLVEGIEDEH